MAWATCPTHGVIQDAKGVREGKPYITRLFCKCGLECGDYAPDTWIDPSTLFRQGQDIIAEAEAQEATAKAEAAAKSEAAAKAKKKAVKKASKPIKPVKTAEEN